MAAQLHAAQQVLAGENFRRVTEGESPDDVYPDAVVTAENTFEWLRTGMGDMLRRPAAPDEADAATSPARTAADRTRRSGQ